MPQTPTLRRNNLGCGEEKIVKLYIQPRGLFLGPLPGLASCPWFQRQFWAWSSSVQCGGSRKCLLWGFVTISKFLWFVLSEEYYITKEGLEKKIMCFKNSGENSHFILVFYLILISLLLGFEVYQEENHWRSWPFVLGSNMQKKAMHFIICDDDRWSKSIWLGWFGALLHCTQEYFNFSSYFGADIQV